jgi:hypothetical protein
MTHSNPHYINELQSDLRGVKADKRGYLLLGPLTIGSYA